MFPKDSDTREGRHQGTRTMLARASADEPPSYADSMRTTLPNVVMFTEPPSGAALSRSPPPKYEDLHRLHQSSPRPRSSGDLFHPEVSLHEDSVVFSSGTLIFQRPSSTLQILPSDDLEEPVDDSLCLSVASVICCAAIGIRALLKSLECRAALHRGDEDMARVHGHHARNLAWLAISLGTMVVLMFLLIFLKINT